jgi:hypothetical protein
MADVDHLYALPLEEFTPARDAAAREIRKAGDRETAAVVAKLPKPTPAAWTANQVAREQPELIEAMLDAGEALREAQEAAVSGAGGRGLREATLAERAAVDAVMAAASEHRPAGRALSRAVTDRLRTTLHAAAADEAIREALAAGRLVSEAQAGGAWPFALEPGEPAPVNKKPVAKAKAKAKPKAAEAKGEAKAGKAKAGKAKPAQEDAAKREAAAAREAAEKAEREREAQERKALEAQLRDARGSLRVRERVLAGAQEDFEQAAAAVTEAQEALEAAKRAVEDAQSEAESAERVLAEARAALDEARDDVARLEERLD